VLWGPLVDASISRKVWVIVGVLLTSAGLGGLTAATGHLGTRVLTICAFAAGSGAIIVGLASKSIAAYVLPLEQRSLAGAWYSAGNLGSYSVGAAAGIWLLTSITYRPLIAAIVSVTVLLSLIGVLCLPSEARKPPTGIGTRVAFTVTDIWRMARTPKGSVALLLCISPFGTGVASILMASVAPAWHAGVSVVAYASALGAPVSAVAALVGGWVAVRYGIWRSYMFIGLLIALLGLIAAVTAHTAAAFFTISIAYSFLQGALWTAFYALVFDTIGQGAASTKMGALLSLANVPFWYGALIEGRAFDRWGVDGLMLADFALGVLGFVAVVLLARLVHPPLWTRPPRAFARAPVS
jgi:predicted MFS family arabinose efflux permease